MESKRKFTVGQNGMPQGNVGQDNYYYWRGVPQVRARVRRRGNSGASSSQLTRQQIFSSFSKLGTHLGGSFAKGCWPLVDEGQTAYGLMQKTIYERIMEKIGDSGEIVSFINNPLSFLQKNVYSYYKDNKALFFGSFPGGGPGLALPTGTLENAVFPFKFVDLVNYRYGIRVCCLVFVEDDSDWGFSCDSFLTETGIAGEYTGQSWENVFTLPGSNNGELESMGSVALSKVDMSEDFTITFSGLSSLSYSNNVYLAVILSPTASGSTYGCYTTYTISK